ncbi:tetratricopeptide repeat protein [Pseudomonas sp.]|uniref:tetratricopeptide repeat protein n=1 Tax=Pseudomonas sp. TaxID=306 RepID=UPI002906F2B1|nr:tetratricopeptide repeat protein [Pseudomonas sp.]MDU4254580.1 tetratricopeptide repeat protein [Pseudomonas sp.]
MPKRFLVSASVLALLAGCATDAPLAPIESAAPVRQPVEQPSSPKPSAQQLPVVVPGARELYQRGMDAKAAGNYPAMLDNLMASADAGDAQAHYELARLLSEGKLVVRDQQAARLYLERSAELGNPEAMRVLAWNTLRGDGVPADQAKGVAMMQSAAESSVRAQRELGMLYANIYKPQLNNFDKANHYLTMAAEAGDADAQYQLGRLKEGAGDAMGALEWFDKARNAGHPKAGAALAALQNGEKSAAPLVTPQVAPEPVNQEQHGIEPDVLYQRAMDLLGSRRTLSSEQDADVYAMLTIASEGGNQLAAQELGLQSGLKQRLDKQQPGWLEQAKQRVMRQE